MRLTHLFRCFFFLLVRRYQLRTDDEIANIDEPRYDQSIDRATLQDRARTTFDRTVADIETKIVRMKTSVNTNVIDADEDDIFPGAAKDMGSGSMILLRKCVKQSNGSVCFTF